MSTETIAAISTGTSESGISIIRISGPDAVKVADSIFLSCKEGKKLRDQKTHTIHYGSILSDGQAVDEVLVSVMKAPHTYTAEDVVEINCHGGSYVTKKILNVVIHHGARLAEPGEFSKRAFLNGRIDLSQAEAVMEVIHSKNELSLRNSIAQLKGRMKEKIGELREKILRNTAFIEAALDDPEHYSLEGYPEQLKNDVLLIREQLQKLYEQSENGRIIRDGIKTVILGKPNVGKSSLLNLFSGTERAIVTDIAGTTRDTIEESVLLNELRLNLVDTAGMRETADTVEKIGVEKAKREGLDADLILYLVDAQNPLSKEDKQYLSEFQKKNLLLLVNKIDLSEGEEEERRKTLKEQTGRDVLCISAKTSYGINELSQKIEEMFFHRELTENEELYLTGERQRQSLLQAIEAMNQVLQSIELGMPEDFYTIDLMQGYEALLSITGEAMEEDLVNKIFHEFCMGK